MLTYKDIQKTEDDVIAAGYFTSNNFLKSIEVIVLSSMACSCALEVNFMNCTLFGGVYMGYLLSEVVKCIVSFLDIEGDISLSQIKNMPVRIVTTDKYLGRVIGIGHFMEDRFLMADDIIKLAKENAEATAFEIVQKAKRETSLI